MKRATRVLAGVLLVGLIGCGGDSDSRGKDPFAKVDPQITKVKARAAPRWEPIATIRGTQPKAGALEVSKRAIQWRARWRCTRGKLAMSVAPKPRSAPERPGGTCPSRLAPSTGNAAAGQPR